MSKYMYYPSLHGLLFIFLVGLISCNENEKNEQVDSINEVASPNSFLVVKKEQFEQGGYALGSWKKHGFKEVVDSKGWVDLPPESKWTLSPFMGGIVKTVTFLPGDRVQKGDVLLVLENLDFIKIQQEYLMEKEQIDYLRSDYQRQEKLYKDSISSKKSYLEAKSLFNQSRVRLQSLAEQLKLLNISAVNLTANNLRSYINLYSRINGYITEVNVSPGQFISPSFAVMQIVDPDHMHLELVVYEKDLMKIKIGQEVNFSIQTDHNRSFKAEVFLINAEINETDRTVSIHCHLKDEMEGMHFIPGMYVEAQIETGGKEHWALPESAWIEVDGQGYILVLKEEREEELIFTKYPLFPSATDDTHIRIPDQEDLTDQRILIRGIDQLF